MNRSAHTAQFQTGIGSSVRISGPSLFSQDTKNLIYYGVPLMLRLSKHQQANTTGAAKP